MEGIERAPRSVQVHQGASLLAQQQPDLLESKTKENGGSGVGCVHQAVGLAQHHERQHDLKKDQIKGLKMIFRRQGETVAQSKMQAYVHPDKAEKDVKNCFRFLKQMDDKYALCCIDDKESDSWMVITTLKEARDLTISLL